MDIHLKIAIAFNCIAMTLIAAFGFVYLFRRKSMPYHEAAIGMA